MLARGRWLAIAGLMLCAAGGRGARAAERPAAGETRVAARVVLARALPALQGERLRVTVVRVDYGPGESSPAHTHPCPVVGYVAEGAIRTQVKGEAPATYRAGESFYEAPNGVHLVSANASPTDSATLIAYFVCDREAPLAPPVPSDSTHGGRAP
ncbi:MAG TPA: cupin domain-containing protein [Gemmatimonadaceae bacterium]|nr:cupin domain-containing protein [Gemmatimonadaceae bacterium]